MTNKEIIYLLKQKSPSAEFRMGGFTYSEIMAMQGVWKLMGFTHAVDLLDRLQEGVE